MFPRLCPGLPYPFVAAFFAFSAMCRFSAIHRGAMCWCRFGGFLWDVSLAHRRRFLRRCCWPRLRTLRQNDVMVTADEFDQFMRLNFCRIQFVPTVYSQRRAKRWCWMTTTLSDDQVAWLREFFASQGPGRQTLHVRKGRDAVRKGRQRGATFFVLRGQIRIDAMQEGKRPSMNSDVPKLACRGRN